jgi:hypothetical protein
VPPGHDAQFVSGSSPAASVHSCGKSPSKVKVGWSLAVNAGSTATWPATLLGPLRIRAYGWSTWNRRPVPIGSPRITIAGSSRTSSAPVSARTPTPPTVLKPPATSAGAAPGAS